ncbi:MAG: hypothetical protein NVS2B12_27750 [Ktedonobacteraceae bacterium]
MPYLLGRECTAQHVYGVLVTNYIPARRLCLMGRCHINMVAEMLLNSKIAITSATQLLQSVLRIKKYWQNPHEAQPSSGKYGILFLTSSVS